MKQTAAVAHEDFRGVQIEDKESGSRAEQNRKILRVRRTPVPRARVASTVEPAIRLDAGTQAIHVVEQIERVRQTDNPHHRQERVDASANRSS